MKKFIFKYKDKVTEVVITGIILKFILEIIPNIIFDNKNFIFIYLMKILKFPILIKIYHIVLFAVLWFFISWIYRKIKGSMNKLIIVEAKYYTSTQSLDITKELNELIENDRLKIVLSNNIAGDPHRHVVKNGLIRYRINGNIYKKSYREGDIIDIP